VVCRSSSLSRFCSHGAVIVWHLSLLLWASILCFPPRSPFVSVSYEILPSSAGFLGLSHQPPTGCSIGCSVFRTPGGSFVLRFPNDLVVVWFFGPPPTRFLLPGTPRYPLFLHLEVTPPTCFGAPPTESDAFPSPLLAWSKVDDSPRYGPNPFPPGVYPSPGSQALIPLSTLGSKNPDLFGRSRPERDSKFGDL